MGVTMNCNHCGTELRAHDVTDGDSVVAVELVCPYEYRHGSRLD